MTLDQVPTEERTAPLNLSQVPLETALGVSLPFLSIHMCLQCQALLGCTGRCGIYFLVRVGMQVKNIATLCVLEACFGVIKQGDLGGEQHHLIVEK